MFAAGQRQSCAERLRRNHIAPICLDALLDLSHLLASPEPQCCRVGLGGVGPSRRAVDHGILRPSSGLKPASAS